VETRRSVLTSVRADIAKNGQSVVGVADDEASFYYTVGRTDRGLPELLIVAPLSPASGIDMLNALDERMPEALPAGSRVNIGGDVPVALIDATNPKAKLHYTLVASAMYGEEGYRVQQVLLPDDQGRLPPRCRAPYSRQPVLGARPPALRRAEGGARRQRAGGK
jgi:hypothetical protein